MELQRLAGNHAVQRLFGFGKKKPKLTAMRGPKTERQTFDEQTFREENFRPSTTIGKFDVVYRPSTGILEVISKVHFKFNDVTPEYYAVMADKKEKSWTSAGKKKWKENWIDSVMTKWGDIPAFKCDKPGYADVVAKPQVRIEIVDKPEKAHYALSVDKAFRKKEGGMRAGGTSGVTREFGGGFQEQDAYDKINNPKVKQHLAEAENKGNIIPAFNRDRERMTQVLSGVAPVAFRVDTDQYATGTAAANARKAAEAITGLGEYSALSDLHPIVVNIGVGDDEAVTLLNDRLDVLKATLGDVGVKNPVTAKRAEGAAAGSVTFTAGEDTEEIKKQYLARWDRYTAAHEFGHMMGLLDEYCPAVSPELIAKMVQEGQLGAGEQALSEPSKGKIGSFAGPQKGYAELLDKAGLRAQAWTRPGAGSSGERSTSLMSGGFEVLRQHHVTLREAVAKLTKDYIPDQNWKM